MDAVDRGQPPREILVETPVSARHHDEQPDTRRRARARRRQHLHHVTRADPVRIARIIQRLALTEIGG
jgi:hypothetical protein